MWGRHRREGNRESRNEFPGELTAGARTVSITMQARTRLEHNIIEKVSPWACGVAVRAIGAGVIVALIVLCMFLAQRSRAAVRIRDEAVASRDRSERLVLIMQEALSRGSDQSSKPLAATISSMIDEVKSAAGSQPDITTRLLVAGAQHTAGLLLMRGGEIDRASALLEESYAVRVRELGPLHADVGRGLAALGELCLLRRDWRGAQQRLEDAARVMRAVGVGGSELGLVLIDLGTAMSATGEPPAPLLAFTQGLALLEDESGAMFILRRGQAHQMRADLRSRVGDQIGAAEDFARAVEAKVNTLGSGDQGTLATLRAALDHAQTHGLHARVAEHLRMLLRSQNISESDRSQRLGQLAQAEMHQQSYQEAEASATAALVLLARARGDFDPLTLQLRELLIRAMIAQNDLDGAESVLADCLADAGRSVQEYELITATLAPAAVDLYKRWKKAGSELWWRDVLAETR